MDDWAYFVIVTVAVIVVALVFVFKKSAKKAGEEVPDELMEQVSFVIIGVDENINGDGTVEVDGIVKNDPISVGERFTLVDKNFLVIANCVKVERIDKGVIKEQLIEIADVGEQVSLILTLPAGVSVPDVPGEVLYLKR